MHAFEALSYWRFRVRQGWWLDHLPRLLGAFQEGVQPLLHQYIFLGLLLYLLKLTAVLSAL